MHTASPLTINGKQGFLQTHNITLPGRYSPIQRQLTYKCIVNNNADDTNKLTKPISLENTQNWLKVHYNSKSPKQHCTQYHLQSPVSRENAFGLVSGSSDTR